VLQSRFYLATTITTNHIRESLAKRQGLPQGSIGFK